MDVVLAPSSRRNRTRSPSYPYLDLQSALEKAAVLWHAEGRHAASISVVMQHWGYKEESSTGYSCVAALKKFGLVDHDGIGETRQMKLSALALRILLDDDPQSAERRAALREAALGPRIHAELRERYGIDLPSDQSLKRFLVLERNFNEAVVDELLAGYRRTMAFAGLALRGVGDGPPAATGEEGSVARLPLSPVPGAISFAPAAASPTPPTSVDGAALAMATGEPRQGYPLPSQAIGPQSATLQHPASSPAARAATHGRDLFDERNGAVSADDALFAEEAQPGRRPAAAPAPAGQENASPWSTPRRELPVPLDNGLVASVPYPMTEEDFALLIDTLQLWKKRLVQPTPR